MNQLNVNQQQIILTLRQQGWSTRRIARELGLDRATVRKYLAEADSKSPTPQAGSAESPPPKSPTNPQTGSSSGNALAGSYFAVRRFVVRLVGRQELHQQPEGCHPRVRQAPRIGNRPGLFGRGQKRPEYPGTRLADANDPGR